MHRLDFVLDAFNGFEVLDGLDVQFGGGVFVYDDERPWVHLERGECPEVVDALLYSTPLEISTPRKTRRYTRYAPIALLNANAFL